MSKDIGRDGTFWLFASFAACSVIFGIVRVPETKNRSLEQIEQELGGTGRQAAERAA